MKIKIAYGKKGQVIQVPDQNLVKVLSMKQVAPLSELYIELTKTFLEPIGLHHSLFDMAKRRSSACVLVCDITRPVPNKIILPPMLKTLHAAGLEYDDILLLIATGIHRPNLDQELVELLGSDIIAHYHVKNHYAHDLDSHRYLGTTSRGTEVHIDHRYLDADFKIATGFIEPHLMAGFSGGRKLIVPGIASIETMKYMHGARLLSHPDSREGIVDGNPFHEEALEIARMAGVDFIVNVALDEEKNIIKIFSGDLEQAHAEGVKFVQGIVQDSVPEPVDIVITSGGGYPLDKTWYQTIKGVTAAMPIVKKGGTIIVISECSEGIGGEEFTRLVCQKPDLRSFMDEILKEKYFITDQWMLQEYAKVALERNVILVSNGLTIEQKNSIHVPWADSVDSALQQTLQKHSESASIAVIPKGPYILATLGSI
jgi:lactate racemase